jgi:hypothetical protein
MVRAPNQGADLGLLAGKERSAAARSMERHEARNRSRPARSDSSVFAFAVNRSGGRAPYFAPVALAYLRRNLSTRPAVSTIFCLPV